MRKRGLQCECVLYIHPCCFTLLFSEKGSFNSTVIFTSVHFSQMNSVHLVTVVARLILKDSLPKILELKIQLID